MNIYEIGKKKESIQAIKKEKFNNWTNKYTRGKKDDAQIVYYQYFTNSYTY